MTHAQHTAALLLAACRCYVYAVPVQHTTTSCAGILLLSIVCIVHSLHHTLEGVSTTTANAQEEVAAEVLKL